MAECCGYEVAPMKTIYGHYRAKAGAMVCLLSENEDKLKEVENKMKQEGLEKCCSVVCDVRDAEQVWLSLQPRSLAQKLTQ